MRQSHSIQSWMTDFSNKKGGLLSIGYETEILDFKYLAGGIFNKPGTGSGLIGPGSQDAFAIKNFSSIKGAELFVRRTIYSWTYSDQDPIMYSKIVMRVPRADGKKFQAYIMSWELSKSPFPILGKDPYVYTDNSDLYRQLDEQVNVKTLLGKFNFDTTGWGQPFPDVIINKDNVEVQINRNIIYVPDTRETAISLLFDTALLIRDKVDQLDR